MPITLPSSPPARDFAMRLIDFGGVITPPLGGEQQRINRLGNRWALAVTLPAMRQEPDGRKWAAALNLAMTDRALYPLPQADFSTDNQARLVNSPNYWANDTDPSLWAKNNVNYAAAGVIGGVNAGTFTGNSAVPVVYGSSVAASPDDSMTLVLSLRAGSIGKVAIGLSNSAGWGAVGDMTITISGPGSIVNVNGSLNEISGLSTSVTTTVTLVRRALIAGAIQPVIYINGYGTGVSGNSLVLFGPSETFATTPTSPWRSTPPGNVLVNGAGQTGSTINLDGFTTDYLVRAGQFFNIIIDGRRFLYQASADTAASPSGAMALPITPMIRKSPPDNAVCEFAAPMIEGFLQGDGRDQAVDVARMSAGMTFTIMEAA